jgi:CheY-like chemotaxis protein
MQTTITIGPVPTASAISWIGAANETLRVLREERDVSVPADVLAAFEYFVGEWTTHAEQHPETFHWSGEVDDAVLRRVGLHWAVIVSVTRSGRIHTLSAAPPEGAAFYDALANAIAEAMATTDEPELADAFAEAVPAFDRERPPPSATPVSVLIVDDNPDIRLLIRVWLEGDPAFEVAGEAPNARAGIELAAATRPRVVVLDIEMPGMTGIEALPLLLEATPDSAVVVFSANDEQGSEAIAAGAVAFVSKSAPISGLLGIVLAAVEEGPAEGR